MHILYQGKWSFLLKDTSGPEGSSCFIDRPLLWTRPLVINNANVGRSRKEVILSELLSWNTKNDM